MYELVYGSRTVEVLIRKAFPWIQIKDASDDVHEERFEVEGKISEPMFYRFAIKEGFALCCFAFSLMLYDKERAQTVKRWIAQVKEKEVRK